MKNKAVVFSEEENVLIFSKDEKTKMFLLFASVLIILL